MQGLDILLGGIMIGLFALICFGAMVVDFIARRRRESAARGRLKFLLKHIEKPFSLSLGWRWHFRCGYRKGRKKGREEGIEIGMQRAQHIEVVNRCRPHMADLVPQVVQLYDGRMVQAWFCPHWEGHIMQPYPELHAFPAARFMQQKEIHQWQVAATDTQLHPVQPKKIKLS